jgi:hypothetical protein
MKCHPATSSCPLAVEIRRQKVMASHPLHNHMDEEPRPCLAKGPQMMASLLEAEEDCIIQIKETAECLRLIRTEIAIRRDESQEPLGVA